MYNIILSKKWASKQKSMVWKLSNPRNEHFTKPMFIVAAKLCANIDKGFEVPSQLPQELIVSLTSPPIFKKDNFKLVKLLFRTWFKMIRWFLLRYLDGKDVIRLTSVEKLTNDVMFS